MKALVFLVSFLLAWSPLAWGHAALVSSTPAAGALLDQAPRIVILNFSEPIDPIAVRLFDPQGHELNIDSALSQSSRLQIKLPENDSQGSYLLSWRVVSADGHPIGSTLVYSVGAPSPNTGPGLAPPSIDLPVAIWLTRWLIFLCLFAASGAALFRFYGRIDKQPWVRPVIMTGLLLLPIALGIQGLDLLAAPWAELGTTAVWSAALASPYAWTLGLIGLSLLTAAAGLSTSNKSLMRLFAISSPVLAGLGLAASGHAGTAPPQWLSRTALVLHVMTAIAWAGALVPLIRSLRQYPVATNTSPNSANADSLRFFSRWITPAVGILIIAGILLVYVQFLQPGDLWKTAYGQVLMAKLILVGLLLGLAAKNRWSLTRSALAGSKPALDRLKKSIRLELVLVVLILATVAL